MGRLAAASLLLALAALAAIGDPNAPPTTAERIAGRWRITLEGLNDQHADIMASIAVEGELLSGTLTVGRESVNVTSGTVVGLDFSFSFRHAAGDPVRMKGTAGAHGLTGKWEFKNERGTWRAVRSK